MPNTPFCTLLRLGERGAVFDIAISHDLFRVRSLIVVFCRSFAFEPRDCATPLVELAFDQFWPGFAPTENISERIHHRGEQNGSLLRMEQPTRVGNRPSSASLPPKKPQHQTPGFHGIINCTSEAHAFCSISMRNFRCVLKAIACGATSAPMKRSRTTATLWWR